jgi:transcriptional regulator with GAF, ATPase, and Fis domain
MIFSSEEEINGEELIFSSNATQTSPTSPLQRAKQENAMAFERQYLVATLREHQGNVSKAAQQSGVERRNFQALLKRHGLIPADFK